MARSKKETDPRSLDEAIFNMFLDIHSGKIQHRQQIDDIMNKQYFNSLVSDVLFPKKLGGELLTKAAVYLDYLGEDYNSKTDILTYCLEHDIDVRVLKNSLVINHGKVFEDHGNVELIATAHRRKSLGSRIIKIMRGVYFESKRLVKSAIQELRVSDDQGLRFIVGYHSSGISMMSFDPDRKEEELYPYYKPDLSEKEIKLHLKEIEPYHDKAKLNFALYAQNLFSKILIDTSDFCFKYTPSDDRRRRFIVNVASQNIIPMEKEYKISIKPIIFYRPGTLGAADSTPLVQHQKDFGKELISKTTHYKKHQEVSIFPIVKKTDKFVNFSLDKFPKINVYRSEANFSNEVHYFLDIERKNEVLYYEFTFTPKNGSFESEVISVHEKDFVRDMLHLTDLAIESEKYGTDKFKNALDWLVNWNAIQKKYDKAPKWKIDRLVDYMSNYIIDIERTRQTRRQENNSVVRLLRGLKCDIHEPKEKFKGKNYTLFQKKSTYKAAQFTTTSGEIQFFTLYDLYNYYFGPASHKGTIQEQRKFVDLLQKVKSSQTTASVGRRESDLLQYSVEKLRQKVEGLIINFVSRKPDNLNDLVNQIISVDTYDSLVKDLPLIDIPKSRVGNSIDLKWKIGKLSDNIRAFLFDNYIHEESIHTGLKVANFLYGAFMSQGFLKSLGDKDAALRISDDLLDASGINYRLLFKDRIDTHICSFISTQIRRLYHSVETPDPQVVDQIYKFGTYHKCFADYHKQNINSAAIEKLIRSMIVHYFSANPLQIDKGVKQIIEDQIIGISQSVFNSIGMQIKIGKEKYSTNIVVDSSDIKKDLNLIQELYKNKYLADKFAEMKKYYTSSLSKHEIFFLYFGERMVRRNSNKYDRLKKEFSESGILNDLNDRYFTPVDIELTINPYNYKHLELLSWKDNMINNVKTAGAKTYQTDFISKLNGFIKKIRLVDPDHFEPVVEGMNETFLRLFQKNSPVLIYDDNTKTYSAIYVGAKSI